MRSLAIRAPAAHRHTQNATLPERKAPNADEAAWEKLGRWVRSFSWIIAAGVAWGIFLAHIFAIVGKPWSTCGTVGCVLTFHLFEVPLVAYDVFLVWYGLRRFSRTTERQYRVILGFANVVNLSFFAFEAQLLIDSFNRSAPLMENLGLVSIALLLVTGVALGLWTQLWLTHLAEGEQDSRYSHPTTERALVALVKRARQEGRQLRVRGSGHSVYGAIHADGTPQANSDASGANLNVLLDRYTQILDWNEEKKQVTVQAGCHLGIDPNDPLSKRENSLLYQLDQRGWALPDLGGITHQTVAGFLSTGSAGGTTTFDLGGSIACIRMIDGTGKVHEFRPNPDDPSDEENNPFYAAGVSMGLLGVISTVTFQCEPRYDIIGEQVTSRVEASGIELSGEGDTSLRSLMQRTEYSRLLWWPQRDVNKLQVWKARRTRPEDARKTHINGRFIPKPFVSFPTILGMKELSQGIINAFYTLISRHAPPYERKTQDFIEGVLNTLIKDGTEEFWDSWYEGLPMDNGADDALLPTEFTELFIDIHQTPEVMRELERFFAGDEGLERTGAYACEIYPARRSRFWLSPSYARDCVRVDIFWFKTRQGNPDIDFYPQYWELLRKFDFRFHWGKYLSAADSSTGAAYIRRQFPKWGKFMELRDRMDPDGVFLTGYWREHLAIEPAASNVTPLRRVEQEFAPREAALKKTA
ncbi:D-arabinono-1,4-lactone oxidase [Hyalangium versicolor]|uniref:D-arabinono-1,4-lactone oxidase n=1 Tax=Hyalangium versicolor TaxID=2861190 RepID=UPI001CCB80A7|nr:D-arabinono-1,4-lactone oxidase [Hyalangium versicolor]